MQAKWKLTISIHLSTIYIQTIAPNHVIIQERYFPVRLLLKIWNNGVTWIMQCFQDKSTLDENLLELQLYRIIFETICSLKYLFYRGKWKLEQSYNLRKATSERFKVIPLKESFFYCVRYFQTIYEWGWELNGWGWM